MSNKTRLIIITTWIVALVFTGGATYILLQTFSSPETNGEAVGQAYAIGLGVLPSMGVFVTVGTLLIIVLAICITVFVLKGKNILSQDKL